MSINQEIFNPEDTEKIKTKLEDDHPDIPCNIYGYIKELKAKIEELEARILELESK